MSKIAAAAIRLTDGRVFTGQTHAQAFWAADEAGVDTTGIECDVGYVDVAGNWVQYAGPHLARAAAEEGSPP